MSYHACHTEVAIGTTSSLSQAAAWEGAKALLGYPVGRFTASLTVEEDAVGDQRLVYMIHATGEARIATDPGREVLRNMVTPMLVDALTGEVVSVFWGDWSSLGRKPPLTRPIRAGPYVTFRGHHVRLIRKPLTRHEHVLISKILLEGIGAKIAFEEASGKLVLEKAADPIVCTVGSLDATQDGEPFQLPVPPEVVNGHPYLPVVLVTRLLGMPVRWDAEKDRLYIDCEGRPEPE